MEAETSNRRHPRERQPHPLSSSSKQPQRSLKEPIGAYVPPAKRVKSEKLDEGSEEHQKLKWNENKKKITGLVNRANTKNVKYIINELLCCNLVRYKGIFASALIKAQEFSQKFTDVYAAILSYINTRLPFLGKLVVNRLIINYRIAFLNDDKPKCLASIKFIGHLFNQGVIHEILPLEILHHLLDNPTTFSVELALNLTQESGSKLDEVSAKSLSSVFQVLRELLVECDTLDKRTHELIDLVLMIRRDRFKDYPPIKRELELVKEEECKTHEIDLTAPKRDDYQIEANHFKYEANWLENEQKYDKVKKSWFGGDDTDNSEEDDDDDDYDDDDDDDDSDEEEKSSKFSEQNSDKKLVKEEKDDKKLVLAQDKIVDETGADLVDFRRKIYLTIQSSLDHEETVHKILRQNIPAVYEDELCMMILDCCAQQRTYIKLYGLIASLLCDKFPRTYSVKFAELFEKFYDKIHMMTETNKSRNTARFFSHLLMTNSIDYNCLACVRLSEHTTSSAGRCFIKFLFEELKAILTIPRLKKLINDPTKSAAFKNIFPKDNEEDTRYAIRFFKASDLSELVENLMIQEM